MARKEAQRRWSLLSRHGLALLVIAHDPRSRLRDIAAALGVTERTAQRVVSDLVRAGYLEREQAHGRNVYTVRAELPFLLPVDREVRIGDLLALLAPSTTSPALTARAATAPAAAPSGGP